MQPSTSGVLNDSVLLDAYSQAVVGAAEAVGTGPRNEALWITVE